MGRDVGLWSGKWHVPIGAMTEGVHGAGRGRTKAQGFMVSGGSYLFCEFICLFSL